MVVVGGGGVRLMRSFFTHSSSCEVLCTSWCFTTLEFKLCYFLNLETQTLVEISQICKLSFFCFGYIYIYSLKVSQATKWGTILWWWSISVIGNLSLFIRNKVHQRRVGMLEKQVLWMEQALGSLCCHLGTTQKNSLDCCCFMCRVEWKVVKEDKPVRLNSSKGTNPED